MARRVLNRLKANRLRRGLGTPSSQEGVNGDFTVRTTNNGEILYIRHNNRWNYVTKLQRVLESGRTRSLATTDSSSRLALTEYLIIKDASGTMTLHSNKLTVTTDFTLEVGNNKLLIDANNTTTTTSPGPFPGLHIDYDQTGASGSGEAPDVRALRIDLNSNLPSHVGDVLNYGLYSTLTGTSSSGATTYGYGMFNVVTGYETMVGFQSKITDGSPDFKLLSSANVNDYCTISTTTEGATKILTVDADTAVAHLTLDADGDINLDAITGNNLGLNIKFAGTTCARFEAHHANTYFTMFENMGASEDDYFRIACAANGATRIGTVDQAGITAHLSLVPDGNLILDPETSILMEKNIRIKEESGAGVDTASYGQIWVKNEDPCELYFTNDDGNDIQITDGTSMAGGGGTQYWSHTVGGYKTNNNSASNYYFASYTFSGTWNNYDSSPTSVNYTDAYSFQWGAPADGTLTNIHVVCRALDTGLTDPLKFYVYKGTVGNNATSTSLTLIGTTGTITPIASKQMMLSTDISSSNTFSAGDKLWIMYKKDSTSANQDLYFSATISGEYA